MNDDKTQRIAPQRAESATPSLNKVSRYVMPGLCPRVVNAFRRRRNVIPTPRTLAQDLHIEPAVATTALIHDLYEQVQELRDDLHRKPVASATVREFRLSQRSA